MERLKWVGEHNNGHYKAASDGIVLVSIGDNVYVSSGGGGLAFIARLEDMWEEDGQKMAMLQWFYRPEDTNLSPKARSKLCPRDILASEAKDANSLDTVLGKCTVAYGTPAAGDRSTHLCRFVYNPDRNTLRRLRVQEAIAFDRSFCAITDLAEAVGVSGTSDAAIIDPAVGRPPPGQEHAATALTLVVVGIDSNRKTNSVLARTGHTVSVCLNKPARLMTVVRALAPWTRCASSGMSLGGRYRPYISMEDMGGADDRGRATALDTDETQRSTETEPRSMARTPVVASMSSRAVCNAVEQVLEARCRNAFCVVGPPSGFWGDHGPVIHPHIKGSTSSTQGAHEWRGGGFNGGTAACGGTCCGACCVSVSESESNAEYERPLYTNHVVSAVEHALKHKSGLARRIAVIDWDLHHGSGSEQSLAAHSQVLYCSIHASGPCAVDIPVRDHEPVGGQPATVFALPGGALPGGEEGAGDSCLSSSAAPGCGMRNHPANHLASVSSLLKSQERKHATPMEASGLSPTMFFPGTGTDLFVSRGAPRGSPVGSNRGSPVGIRTRGSRTKDRPKDRPKDTKNLVCVPVELGSGPSAFLNAFLQHVVPAVDQFQPDLIIIAAGFDGHKDDWFGRALQLNATTFVKMTTAVMEVAERHCNSRIVSILAGGANPRVLAECCCAHVGALARVKP